MGWGSLLPTHCPSLPSCPWAPFWDDRRTWEKPSLLCRFLACMGHWVPQDWVFLCIMEEDPSQLKVPQFLHLPLRAPGTLETGMPMGKALGERGSPQRTSCLPKNIPTNQGVRGSVGWQVWQGREADLSVPHGHCPTLP